MYWDGWKVQVYVIMASTCFFCKALQPKPALYWKCIMFGDCFPKSPIDKEVYRARSLFESCRKLWSSSFWSAHSWTRSKATVNNELGNLLQFSVWCLKAWGLFIIWLLLLLTVDTVYTLQVPLHSVRCGRLVASSTPVSPHAGYVQTCSLNTV